MDNNQVTAEWIAQQREKAKDAINLERCAYRQAVRATIINEGYPAALDALEAAYSEIDRLKTMSMGLADKLGSMKLENNRLTAERDAAVCDMFGCMSTQGQCVRCKKRYYCDGTDDDKFSPLCKNNSHCYAWEWRGLHADNTDAPTGAERHNPIQDVSMGGMNIHNYGDVINQQFISIDTVDKDLNL